MPNRRLPLLMSVALIALGTSGCREDLEVAESSPAKTSGSGTTSDPLNRLSIQNSDSTDPAIEPDFLPDPTADTAPTAGWVNLPVEPHWKKIDRKSYVVAYLGSPGNTHYIRERTKDLPPADLTDLDAQRQFFREVTKKENGGILSVETQTVQGHDCVVVLSKEVVPKLRGYRYVGRAFFPHDDIWTEVRMDGIQMGATGMREAVATSSLGASMEMEEVPADAAPTPMPGRPAKPGDQRLKGFYFDPYDPAFSSSAINSIADDPQYDQMSPQHPLTRIRRDFPSLLERLTFGDAG
ncbi:MAG: hypothetical protein NXI04_05190 [Planctomycetaceae bacterium]|nr:hypothetical protein [Planctomycetaceae bacterium]